MGRLEKSALTVQAVKNDKLCNIIKGVQCADVADPGAVYMVQ